MKFAGTAAFALTVSVAIAAKLSDSAALDHAKTQCSVGDISCCNSEEETKADGILGNLLAGGLLTEIRSSIKDSNAGPVCKNIIACCPEGTDTCTAIDNS
ncbi:unnamed protein product [Penicillium nalgiovense]|uniref:Hydrophobin n=1 Tax=Penicillium nalgiovense TaxID=60175 RepID=A0A9W4HI44_PENNA|nr:unnamed protein product [Penicillium nalgiovense]CAG7960920.1 unnamed protein product [Penicillium nalgiovense]CAG8001534.1 unnamed protein product [Penicillium nalgiovense]CAG8002639.1 unnamed protein product [Penicillium nalgiovense]CAG8019642.1 unnamed protein product [Penicillium nalgiovense]